MQFLLNRLIAAVLLLAIALGTSFLHTHFLERTRTADAATALEFYFGETTTQESEGTATYNTHTSLTVDRSSETGSVDFFVFAHISVSVNNPQATSKIRLLQDTSTTLGEVSDGFSIQNAQGSLGTGKSFNFVKEVNLDATSHTFDIQFANVSETHNVQAEESSIIVIEKSANAEYSERTSELCSGSNASFTEALGLTFTPGTEDDYVFVWATEVKHEDEDNSGSQGIRFSNSTDSLTYMQESRAQTTNSSSNDNIYYTVGGVSFDTVETSSHLFRIQMDGGGTNDEVCVNRAAIAAIPFNDFENVYSDSQSSESFHGISFSDTTLSITQSVAEAEHLIIAGGESANENINQIGSWQLSVDGTTKHWMRQNPFRDEDGDQYNISFAVTGADLSAGSKTFKVQARSSSSSGLREGVVGRSYLLVIEIPAAAANNAPTISNLSLNGGSDITLTENTFTRTSSTMTITDSDGCSEISSVSATTYLASTTPNDGTTCNYDGNDCYTSVVCMATSTDTCGDPDTTVDYECGFNIWYIAEATDSGAPMWSSSIWSVAATTSDGTDTGTATNTGETVEINTLTSLDVTGPIAYGSIAPGADTGATNQTATTTNTGNVAIDSEVQANDDMCDNYPTCSGDVIFASQQKFATSSVAYASLTFTLSSTTAETIELDLAKPTATTTAIEDLFFWGIAIPAGTPSDSYSGQNTFTAVSD